MLRTLRNRLILSHVLLLVIVIPLLGILLIYTLETQYLIPSLTRNLEWDAQLLADLFQEFPQVWEDPRLANDLLERLDPERTERILLLTQQGTLVGSTDPTDLEQEPVFDIDSDLNRLREGQVVSHLLNNQQLNEEVIEVTAPVLGPDSQLEGIVRLTYRNENYLEEFLRLRYLIGSILLVGMLVGGVLGSLLALNIGKPIHQVTEAVYGLASGTRSQPIKESGPEEIQQLQRAANHLVEQLHTLEDSRRKLLANLVHELGRPLGALRSAIQALRRGAADDPLLMDELLVGMDGETIRLERLSEDLAELYEQVLGRLELEFQPVTLGEWLPGVLAPWKAAAIDKQLSWELSIPSTFPTICFDPNAMAQAVGNLVSNATKFTPVGGKISISSDLLEDEFYIRVEDTGPGISPLEQKKLFTPFSRSSQGQRFPQGMGLGLTIVRDIIEAHGGRIEVNSVPGSGSQFTLWLPKII
jgi:signal transduction histidine kinase